MKKTTIKLLTLILALLLLATSGVLVACVDNEEPDDTTAGVVDDGDQTTEDTTPEFPVANYNNEEFVVISRSPDADSYAGIHIDADEATDTMSSAVFTRNTNTEERYGVVISQLASDDTKGDVQKALDTGTVPFDVILYSRNSMASLSQSNYLYDFNQLDIDYTTAWWDVNCYEEFQIAGKLFFMANDTSVSNLAGARTCFFNKNLVDDWNLTSPHDYIRENNWTLENYLTLVETCNSDVNGDGIYNWDDIYGACDEPGGTNSDVIALLVGSGVQFGATNADGEMEIDLNTTKIDDIISKVSAVYQTGNYITTYNSVSNGADMSGYAHMFNYARGLFAQDHFLFILNNMGVINQFSEMEGKGFGIVPLPKYNSDQDRYYNKVDKHSNIWAIPNTTSVNMEMVANVMDFWAYESSKTVMPAYYDITLKTRRVNDPIDAEMLDIIKNSIVYDIADVYGIAVIDAVWSGYTAGTFSSQWKQLKVIVQRSVDKLNTAMEAMS